MWCGECCLPCNALPAASTCFPAFALSLSLLDVFVTYAGNLYIVFELAATDMKKVFDANRRPYPLPELKVQQPTAFGSPVFLL